jgi:hypothetical protein
VAISLAATRVLLGVLLGLAQVKLAVSVLLAFSWVTENFLSRFFVLGAIIN